MDDANQTDTSQRDTPTPETQISSQGDLSSLMGDYSFYLNGTFPILNPSWIPPRQIGFPWGLLASVGVITFDGNGGLTTIGVTNHNGGLVNPVPPPFFPLTGTYAVLSSNLGTITIDTMTPLVGKLTIFFRWQTTGMNSSYCG